MEILISLSLAALIIKMVLIWRGRLMLTRIPLHVLFFISAVLLQNVVELSLVSFIDDPDHPAALYLLKLYYIMAILICGAVLLTAFQTFGCFTRLASASIIFVTSLLMLIVAYPDMAISGVESIGYSVTRLAGPYYWVVQLFVVGAVVLSVFLFVVSLRMVDWYGRRKAKAILFGLVPVGLGVIVIVALMEVGFKVNATIIIPILVTILFGIMLYAEYEQVLFRLLSFIPMTTEYKMTRVVLKVFFETNNRGLHVAASKFSQILIDDTVNKCNGNKTSAAKLLGVSRATLRRKLDGDE